MIVPDASYRRTFKDGIWEGICLPFELKYEEWCEKGEMAEWVDFIDDNTLVWQIIGEGGKTIAGRPYIFKKHDTNIENETVFSATNTILRSSQEIYPAYTRYFMLTGSYGMLPMMEGMSIYDYVNGEYCKNESPDNLTPYRIYLQALPEFPVNVKNIVVDKVEDAINGIAGKVQGKTYNLQGVEVNAGYKGIVIQNGKKLLKK